MQDFFNKYTNSFDEVEDFLVIKLTAKEKEHKIMPRMFGLTTPENRSRMLLTSMNLFGLLERYFPSICFATPKHSLIEKMLAMKDIAKLALEPSGSFFVHVDASGWNNSFRSPVTDPISVLLDRWFNVKMYTPAQQGCRVGRSARRDRWVRTTFMAIGL